MRAARLCRRMNPEFLYVFALLGENLDSVTAAFADVDETVLRWVCAVQRGRELGLIRRRSRWVIGQRGVIIDFTQGDSFASPASLERACVHVIDQDTLV